MKEEERPAKEKERPAEEEEERLPEEETPAVEVDGVIFEELYVKKLQQVKWRD